MLNQRASACVIAKKNVILNSFDGYLNAATIAIGEDRKMNRQKILTTLRNQEDLFDRFLIKNLYLFGSAAKDMATDTSDVDLLVEFTEDAHVSLFQFTRLRRELSQILGCEVDLVTPEALHPKLKADILKEAVHAA